MARFWIAIMNLLIASVVVTLLFAVPALPAEAASPVLEEVATSIREVKDAMGMFLILYLWLMLGAGTTAISLLGRAFLVDLTNQLDFVARNVTASKSSLIGLLNCAIFFLIAVGLANLEQLAVLAAVILIFVGLMVYLGLLATTLALGEKVLALRADEFSEFAKIIIGNAALFIAALVPIIGWAVFLYIVIKSFGVALIWMVRRKNLAQEVFAHE